MKIDRKLLVPLSMLVVVSVGGAYAFISLTVTTTVNIGEPLSIVNVTGTGDFAGLVCSGTTALSDTCNASVSAGAMGGITVTVRNSGSQALVVTPAGSTEDTDVALVTPGPGTVSAGASFDFVYSVTVSPSATPGQATLSLSFSR